MNTKEISASIAQKLPQLFECSPAPQEGTRVRTPLLYPDGRVVDVFIMNRGDEYLLTDFGEALGWLRMQSTSIRRSRKQNLLILDLCETLGIDLQGGQLTLRSPDNADLAEAVTRVAQAIVKVSDLWYTLRHQAWETTADEVDEWLQEKQIAFERSVQQPGRSGRNWTIDYRTRIRERTTLVTLLSTGTRGTVHRITEHALAGWIDLRYLQDSQPSLIFVSLFDDREDVWQAEDFELAEHCSEIARWSRPDEFEKILTMQ